MVFRAKHKGQKGGCIINISSLLASKGVTGTSVYAASKAGLLGMLVSLFANPLPFFYGSVV
jgi:3-oxoacyl-[acyl-carrier protein] reductase